MGPNNRLTRKENLPDAIVGINQVLPANAPITNGFELKRMSTVETINLSATGSRKAPNGEWEPCQDKQKEVTPPVGRLQRCLSSYLT